LFIQLHYSPTNHQAKKSPAIAGLFISSRISCL
jgi:hypothetical protein